MSERLEKTFEIPEANMFEFVSKIEKLQRRVKKLNCPEVGYEIVGEKIGTAKLSGKTKDDCELIDSRLVPKIKYKIIRVFGDSPKYKGWTFIAKLEHDEEVGTIVCVLPGYELPSSFRDSDRYNCDHCHKKIWRRDTFVVYNEQNEYKQIGRACLRDFLGHSSPEQIAQSLDFILIALSMGEDAERFEASGHRQLEYFDLDRILSLTSALVRASGWISKTKAEETGEVSTASDVSDILFDRSRISKQRIDMNDNDKSNAERAIDWASNLSKSELENDYLYNINLIAKAGVTSARRIGLAVSILISWQRTLDRKSKNDNTKFFGEVGKRLEIGPVVIEQVKVIGKTQWGRRIFCRFTTNDYVFIWFTSDNIGTMNAGESDRCIIKKATIKEHKEFNGVKETIISRPIIEKIK